VRPLVLTLRQRPDQRLDLSPLVPHRLAGKAAAEIERIELQTAKQRVTVGDAFRLRIGDADRLRIESACDRLDRVGQDLREGEILVEGDVGLQAGRGMRGGRLAIEGNAGAWAASGMRDGRIEISGSTGERLGGPLPGETVGMRGGVVVVRGDAGDRAGDRMRRGMVIIEGAAGAHAGSRMIAGTLLLCRSCGPMPGYLMRRGTIVLGGDCEALSPTFVDCGSHELVAMRLIAQFARTYSRRGASVLSGTLRRLAGDMAVLGKGELFVQDRD
jgi:formylmethanofuran dehydrogenase subunit C